MPFPLVFLGGWVMEFCCSNDSKSLIHKFTTGPRQADNKYLYRAHMQTGHLSIVSSHKDQGIS